jgi:hypothetical protein
LHVTHTTRPFMTRIRIAPDVASRPERIKKDLEQIKQLASILEEEAATLRQFSPTQARKAAEAAAATAPTDGPEPDSNEIKVEAGGSTTEGDFDPDVEAEIEPEPKAKGSEAVEKRIAKLIADLQEQTSPSELEDGIGWEAKKVYCRVKYYILRKTQSMQLLQRKRSHLISIVNICAELITPATTVLQSRIMLKSCNANVYLIDGSLFLRRCSTRLQRRRRWKATSRWKMQVKEM